MTFSRNWLPLKSLSDQPATQSQGETVSNASALCSDAVMEQVVSIRRTVIDYSFSLWWLLAPWLLISQWASIYPLTLLWEQSSEFFLSCKTGTLYPLNNSLSLPHLFFSGGSIYSAKEPTFREMEKLCSCHFPINTDPWRRQSVLEPLATVWHETQ